MTAVELQHAVGLFAQRPDGEALNAFLLPPPRSWYHAVAVIGSTCATVLPVSMEKLRRRQSRSHRSLRAHWRAQQAPRVPVQLARSLSQSTSLVFGCLQKRGTAPARSQERTRDQGGAQGQARSAAVAALDRVRQWRGAARECARWCVYGLALLVGGSTGGATGYAG